MYFFTAHIYSLPGTMEALSQAGDIMSQGWMQYGRHLPTGNPYPMLPKRKMRNKRMDKQTRQAYEWALNQNYQSVAARYAKTLAKHIQVLAGAQVIVQELERRYPNWHKFRDIIEALDWHRDSQDKLIERLRKDNERLRACPPAEDGNPFGMDK